MGADCKINNLNPAAGGTFGICPNKDFHLMRAMPRVPWQAPAWILFWTGWDKWLTLDIWIVYKFICMVNVSFFLSKDNFRTFEVRNLWSFPTTIPPNHWNSKRCQNMVAAPSPNPSISPSIHLFICKYLSNRKKQIKNISTYLQMFFNMKISEFFSPKKFRTIWSYSFGVLPIPSRLQDVGLHVLPTPAAWLPSHESSLNVRCYLPWENT